MGKPLTQEEFDQLGKELFNKRVGNFLFIHREANPVWHYFYDIHDNSVMHGGRGDRTDAIIRIKAEHRELLEPRLMAYMKELVGRHDEELHKAGIKQFHGVTIKLPLDSKIVKNPDLEVTIHTGSGCCYDQDEIAYEVMAALSGVPALKVVAEPDSYYGFVRRDKVRDNAWVNFVSERLGITVAFSHIPGDDSYVVVRMYKQHSLENRENWEKFKRFMHERVDEYVQSRTGHNIAKKYGNQVFGNDGHKGQTRVCVREPGPFLDYCVTVPYHDYEAFARWEYARRTMEMLHESFKEEKVPVV